MLDTVPKEPKDYLCVALDLPNMIEVRRFAGMLTPLVGYEKVGLRLITSVGGPTVVHALQNDYGAEVFYDGKFHDIPKTVGEASEAAAMLGVAMFNVHASATIPAMQQAVKFRGSSHALAVTVLTSIGESECLYTYGAPNRAKVHQFALDAKTAGMTGLVCSAEELQMLKLYPDLAGLHPVVPAIRPAGSAKDDQKRVGTPAQAIKDGARVLVVGRPIIEASDPVEATKRILDEIAEGMRLKEVA